jgi:hypothetical protein
MTVIISEVIGRQAYLLSDCLVTRLDSTDPHVSTPLGMYLDDMFPPEVYRRSFVSMQPKSVRIGNKAAIGIAGSYWLGRGLLYHIADHHDDISSLDTLIRVVQQKDGLQDTDISIAGFIVEQERPRAFKYNLHTRELISDVPKVIVGSGEDLADILSEWRKPAEHKMNGVANLLYAAEIFSPDAAFRAMGGVYLGFFYDGTVIRRPRNVTHFFSMGKVTGDGDLVGAHHPFFLNQIYVGDICVVRSLWGDRADTASASREVIDGKNKVATKHLEMQSVFPVFIHPIFYIDNEPDSRMVVEETSKNFSADTYHANFKTIIADEGIYSFSTMWASNWPTCPFKFWGTYQDHWWKLDEKLYLVIAKYAIECFRRTRPDKPK